MLPSRTHTLNGIFDILVDPIQDAALLDDQSLKIFVNLVEGINRLEYLCDFLRS